MKNHLHLNSIRQGNWADIQQPLLREKLNALFLVPIPNAPQPTMRITNHLLQRLSLIAGLSRKEVRNEAAIAAIQLKSTTYFDTLFHNDEFYPLLTALLKIHYHHLEIDWTNAITTSKIINYEMEQGVALLLETDYLALE